MVIIENQALYVEISPHGAELKKIQSKQTGIDYLWDGNGSWKRSAPILFPNIGGLAEEVFVYQGKEYPAPAHGFARDMEFTLKEHSDDRAVFSLCSDTRTAAYFPFSFELEIIYTLEQEVLLVTWHVHNKDTQTMYFSIGAHPGFRLLPDSKLEDYTLYFDKSARIETRRVIGRYLSAEKELLADACSALPLSAELLEKDAIILEDTGIRRITLRHHEQTHGIWIDLPDLPVVAIWTDPHTVRQARFLCLEPWCGINSLCNDKKADISQKARVTALAAGATFERTYRIGIEGPLRTNGEEHT